MAGRSGEVLVVFCDVGPEYGIGHVMRCLALAEEFGTRGWEVVFAADVTSVDFARTQVESRGLRHVPAPAGVEDHLEVLGALGATAAVIDSYHQPVALYAAVSAVYPTIALVDGDPAGRVGLLVVDQNIGAEGDSWALPEATLRLAGLDYALMRTEILVRRPQRPRSEDAPTPRVFAFFGGTDTYGAGAVLTRVLVATGVPFDLRVVVPTPWPDPVEAGAGQRITVIGPTDRIAEEVLDADLVVSAAGTSGWELLCLGAACAFVCVAGNQELSYGRVIDAELALGVGHLGDLVGGGEAAAAAVLKAALLDGDLRTALRDRAWRRVDGGGRARVLDRFEALTRLI
ncbi:MAG: Spore coat polysaccharide biosynthesis protein predicted glycosyltransferase-like protein [Marmoricola sp.]|nr:Spore coat polysaccharide biosynthesis protein predicted glycosyltransferase-like protein [Marmoricola sp.]